MRKMYEISKMIVLMLMMLLLFGCQQEVPAIKSAQLTENEKELLRSVGVERYFIFDVDLSRIDFDELECRVDYYENGKLVEHVMNSTTSGYLSEKGMKRLSWVQIKAGSNQDEVWIIDFAGSKMTRKVTLGEQILAMSWSQNDLVRKVNPGEEIMLAAIVGTKSGNIRSPGIIFDPEEGGIQALEHYDVAYVLTVVFHKDISDPLE